MAKSVLLPGAFDPPLHFHLSLAQEALRQGAERVLLLPLPGAGAQASVEARLRLCQTACEGQTGVAAQALPAAGENLPAMERAAAAQFGGQWAACPVGPREASLCAQAVERLRSLEDALDLVPACVSRCIAETGVYMPDYVPLLRSLGMKDRRLQHTLGVRATAVHLAYRWGAGMQKAALAAMLHDMAKPLSLERMREAVDRAGLRLTPQEYASGNLLHGPAAACLAAEMAGVTDEEILSAIRVHTTGKPGMSLLDKCVFLADAIEPGRAPFPGLETLRALAEENLDEAVLQCMLRTREYVAGKGEAFSNLTEQAILDLQQHVWRGE